jgi:hypothetical protein
MGTAYPGRRLEDSPLPWAIIASSFQDFGLRWREVYSAPVPLRWRLVLTSESKHIGAMDWDWNW